MDHEYSDHGSSTSDNPFNHIFYEKLNGEAFGLWTLFPSLSSEPAAVERTNSAQGVGLVLSHNQKRLAQAHVNALMKVTFNRHIEATANAKAEERALWLTPSN